MQQGPKQTMSMVYTEMYREELSIAQIRNKKNQYIPVCTAMNSVYLGRKMSRLFPIRRYPELYRVIPILVYTENISVQKY